MISFSLKLSPFQKLWSTGVGLVLLLTTPALLTACGGAGITSGSTSTQTQLTATPSTVPALPQVIATQAVVQTTPTPTAAPQNEATPTATKESQLPNLAGRKINIAVENAYLPFNYIELKTGQPGGWDYAAWAEICRRLNCVPNFVQARLDGMLEAVSQGQFDVAADGIVILEERAKLVDFSTGYLNLAQRILVRADESRFETPEQLQAKTELILGAQKGTTNYDTAQKLVGRDRVRSFDTPALAVQALLAGEIDGVIVDEIGGQGYVGPNADKVKLTGPALSVDQFGFAFPKGSDLVEPVNLALATMQADGFLDKLAGQYFSAKFTLTYDDIGPGAYGGN